MNLNERIHIAKGQCPHDVWFDTDQKIFRCNKCPETAPATASSVSVRFRTIPDYLTDKAATLDAFVEMMESKVINYMYDEQELHSFGEPNYGDMVNNEFSNPMGISEDFAEATWTAWCEWKEDENERN